MPHWELWSANETALLAFFGVNGYPYLSASIQIDSNVDCRYAATLVLPNTNGRWSQNEANPQNWVLAENNILKCYLDEDTQVFYGLIDNAVARVDVNGQAVVEVHARSVEKKLIQSCFTDTTAYVDTPGESANYAAASQGATAAASSSVATGDQLQIGAKIIQASGRKQILGIWQDITPPQDASAVKDGSIATSYTWSYSESGLSALELTLRLDLWTPEGIQRLEALMEGNTEVVSLKTSADGFTWTNRSNPAFNLTNVRFIEITFQTLAAGGTATIEVTEIQVLAANSYPASAALDDDAFTSWRPRPEDLDRSITVNFGQARTFNAIYLQFGVNPLDVWDTVQFMLYAGDELIYDGRDKWYSGLVEVALTSAITASSLKIRITSRAGLVAIRYIEVLNITASQNRVSWLLSDFATQAGIPSGKQDITTSWFWRAQLTAQIGDTYWQHAKEVAQAVAWEVYGTPDGRLKAGPVTVDASHPSKTITTAAAKLSQLETQPPQDIRNYIVVLSEQPDRTIRADAKDDSPNSPTSVQRLGNRVQVIQDNTILSQKAANQRAILELWQRSRWRSSRRLQQVDAEVWLEPGEVVRLEEAVTGTSGVYMVQSYDVEMEPGYLALTNVKLVPVG